MTSQLPVDTLLEQNREARRLIEAAAQHCGQTPDATLLRLLARRIKEFDRDADEMRALAEEIDEASREVVCDLYMGAEYLDELGSTSYRG